MNKLTTAKRAAVVAALTEGMSVNATCRLTGVSKPTVLKLLMDLGLACATFLDDTLVNLPTKRVQVDELWSFVYARRQNVPTDKKEEFGYGDVWTFTAIDADTKLIFSCLVGKRDRESATQFMRDVAYRVAGRVQLTSDAFHGYLSAVDDAFDGDVDYARLTKTYASDPNGEARYAPPVVIAVRKTIVTGDPDVDHISTSYMERGNLTIRMQNKRFARLTNAHSKKLANHEAALAIQFMFYNFVRPHQALEGKTPAMAAGVSDRQWSIADVVGLLDRTLEAK